MPQNYASAAQEFARLSSEGAGPCPHCPKPVRLRGLAHWLRSSWSRTSAMSGDTPPITILRFHPFTLRCKLPPLPPPSPRAPQPQAQPPSKEVLTVGRGAPKGGIRLPAPRRRSVGAALRVQLREKGPEAHAAYATEQALSPRGIGESACPVSPASREYSTPLRYRPPKRWAALCVLHALRVARERRSKTKEGGGTPFPPFKIRARKTGTALRKNSASCLSDNPTPTGGEISGRPEMCLRHRPPSKTPPPATPPRRDPESLLDCADLPESFPAHAVPNLPTN